MTDFIINLEMCELRPKQAYTHSRKIKRSVTNVVRQFEANGITGTLL